jgi:phosphoglucomutase
MAPTGGLKVMAPSSWFTAWSSGTENICKLYRKSFWDQSRLDTIIK